MQRSERPAEDPYRIDRVIRRTRVAMALESFVRAFWPLASLLAATWSAFAFGLAEIVGRVPLIVGLGLLALAALALLVHGVRRFRWPAEAAARARVDATLPGRPLAALDDTPAVGRDDVGAQAVWSAHLARMRRLAAAARPVPADLRLAARDPWALRLAALVLLVAAVIFARDPAVETVTAALAPPGGAEAATGPSFEGWAEPPAYTGRPTLYLPEVAADTPVALPEGSTVTLRVYGDTTRFALAEDVTADGGAAFAEAAPGIAAAEFPVARSGTVRVERGDDQVAGWSFVMEEDAPPEIDLAAPIERAPSGETSIAYVARDDYGVTAARAEISLDLPAVDRRYGLVVEPEPRPALVVDLPMPMSGGAEEIAETLVEDFSTNPWVGLPVKVSLIAEDALGQTGRRDEITAVLPGRRFYHPVAAALVEQRRDLLWSGEGNGRRVTEVLRAVSYRPEGAFDSPRAYLITRTAIRRLARAVEENNVPAIRDEVAEALWQAALLLEDGSLGDARERLERAKERLSEALQDGASDEEIAELMEELRDATQDYMEQMAREAIERGEQQMAEAPPGQTMSQDQLQELMDRIQELSEQGRKAEAQAMLDMLQQMLENMQMMMTQGGQPGEGGEGQQSMQGLADALREQQGLADESFRQLQEEFRRGGQPGQGQQGQGQGQQGGNQGQQQGQPGQPGQPGQGDPSDFGSLAERQEALRELMEQLQQNLPGSAGEGARGALDQAERDMGEARDGLEQGDAAGALDRQAEAIENLRQGMRALGEDLQAGQQGEPTPGEGGQARAEDATDPLGRPMGARGSLGTNERMLPEGDIAARARALLDEIRRRSGELARPEIELDYLRRLLDQF